MRDMSGASEEPAPRFAPCGPDVGYDPEAHQKALRAVTEILSAVFKLT